MTYDVAQMDQAILLFESEADELWHIDEMRELAASAGVEVIGEFFSRTRRRPGQGFISADRTEELYQQVLASDANVVVVGADLTPGEHAGLSREVGVRVVDRSQLILDIFAGRAHTREGILQVELAQLSYLLPRLVGKGTEMSRLGGGVGTRGPGETRLEMDRRRLRKRIEVLSDEIDSVRKHREVARANRLRLPLPTAALGGYTSAGKATLLNALGGADVLTDARLFATLDPTTRRVLLPDGWGVLMTDTVGFIRNLPHTLIAAFRATLEEVKEADILIHVVDSSHPHMNQQMQAVRETLEEIGAQDRPVVTVYNKSDICQDTYKLRQAVAEDPLACYISALKGDGLEHLVIKINCALRSLLVRVEGVVPYSRSALVASCHDFGHVLLEDYQEDGIHLVADLSRRFAETLPGCLTASSAGDAAGSC